MENILLNKMTRHRKTSITFFVAYVGNKQTKSLPENKIGITRDWEGCRGRG
jgi:hypothetical protein